MTELLDYLEDETMDEFEKSMNEKANELLQRPFKHHIQKSGKDLRAKFLNTVRRWCNSEDWQIDMVNKYIKLCHNATLLIDDIQDRTILRRGEPASYTIYGISATIQCVNYIVFHLLNRMPYDNKNYQEHVKRIRCSKTPNEIIIPYTKQILKGQIMEVYWRDNFVCPTLEQYLHMISKKTTMVFRLAVDLMTDNYQKDFQFDGLEDVLGQFFQIRDDYLNLKSTQFHDEKGFCEDLTEGKFSFPIVYAINAYPEDGRIMAILKKRPTDVATKLECLKILEELGSFEVTIKHLDKMKKTMQDKIQHLGGNEEFLEFLEILDY